MSSEVEPNVWAAYLTTFHDRHPGITEQAFNHARHPAVGTPYEWLVAALPDHPGRVLDVACGNAPLMARLPDGARYLGLDVSDGELSLAARSGRGPIIKADMRELPLPDGSFDTIVSSMGVMLVQPLTRVFAELARVLRPGGTLAFLVPSMWPLRLGDLRPGWSVARHLHGPGSMPQHVSGRRARKLLRGAALQPVEVASRRFPFPLNSDVDAHLAVHSLYTPGRSSDQLDSAIQALTRMAPDHELPVPLRRVVAVKPVPGL